MLLSYVKYDSTSFHLMRVKTAMEITHKETRDSLLVVPSYEVRNSLADRLFGSRIKDMDGVHVKCHGSLLTDAQL